MSMFGTGRYDNLHGDENECHVHCGICSDCDQSYYQRCDDEYEAWRDEDLT